MTVGYAATTLALLAGGRPPHPEERPLGRVSKDEAVSWFETREDALLTMRN